MPAPLNYPGVYIEELPSAVRAITGVPTSVAAFVGRAFRGPVDEPITLFSWADYERTFGGLWRGSMLGYAVQQFFLNGGAQALVVRVPSRGGTPTTAATIDLGGGNTLSAANPGTWGRNLVVTVDYNTKDTADTNLFNLTIFDDPTRKVDDPKRGGSGAREAFLNVSRDTASPRFVTKVIAEQSDLVRVTAVGAARPAAAAVNATAASGADGADIAQSDVIDDPNSANKTGLYALNKADIFNLLVIPPYTASTDDNGMPTWTAAAKFAKDHRAVLLVDAPASWTPTSAAAGVAGFSAVERAYAALYYPRLRLADPQQDNNLADFAPSGAVAGVIARTDTDRGVWKAPAGIDASLRGVLALSINGKQANLTDGENGRLNPLGINCVRGFPNIGNVVWGARTLEGADALASQWKYLPVRRLALYIEESLFRGTQWVVFEPNDEPLWAQIRLNVGAFMQGLFRQGAFQGTTPREAYLVKCDRETTTQADIDRGVVNIVVGFAPLKPAEFVVIQIQQLAGQSQV